MQSHDTSTPEPTLRVAVFAGMADAIGARCVELPWPGGTVADVRRLVARRHPGLVPLLDRSAVAVDGRYALDTDPVAAGGDVAIIPPVSGG